MARTKKIAAERIPGRKVSKKRISVLCCSDTDGSEKNKLMIIGSSWKPRSFKKRSGDELELDYHVNKKSWMTNVLFHNWLVRFDAYTNSTPNRHVALLGDNCTAHGKSEAILAL